MTPRARTTTADALAAAASAVLVLGVYLATLLAAGGTPDRPGTAPVLVATVVVALLLQPAFVRLRRVARHVLGVTALEPFDLLRRLPESVTGERPAEDIPQNMVRVLAEGLRAHRTGLWLRTPGGLRSAASWPPDPASAPDDPFSPAPDVLCRPIRDGGHELAVLTLEHRPPRELSRLERRLLDAYVAQAGQVVRMLALRATLEERRAELAERTVAFREARAQLLVSQSVERRRLERDLHDGAQQQLLALELGVRLARQIRGRSPERADALVRRAAAQARETAAGLGSLSASLYPRLLESEGPATALRAALAGGAVAVVVQESGTGPAPTPDAARALYFVALEAAQNSAKHAGAPQLRIAITRDPGATVLTVTDRGRGFAPATATTGAGLGNMAERVAALGGRLRVESTPGRGTVVTASVPVTAADPAADLPPVALPQPRRAASPAPQA